MSAVTAIRLRDEGGPRLCAQLLIYPATNLAGPPTQSMLANAHGLLLEQEDMVYFTNHYLRTAADARNPICSPLFEKSLAGLPPALVQTCEFDPLRDEGDAYADALKRDGVALTHLRYEGAIHGVLCFVNALESARTVLEDGVRWLKGQFAKA
jgi:acetyl esterase